jgi:ABC-type Fe3+ transport system permease subunit
MADVTGPTRAPAPAGESAADRTPAPGRTSRVGRWWWLVGIGIVALVVVVLAPLASSDPDGLERVAEDNGFIAQAQNVVGGLLGDYAIPGVDDPAVSTILSGLLGVAILLVVVFLLGRVLARRKT